MRGKVNGEFRILLQLSNSFCLFKNESSLYSSVITFMKNSLILRTNIAGFKKKP
jgi:hypothetical protein